MSKIQAAFAGHKAFIAFITCGDPDLNTTEELIRAMDGAGADVIELGIPFSDPTAEGPVIQAANQRALAGGVTTDMVLDMVRRVRPHIHAALAIMTYANVVFSYGIQRFLHAAADAGINGLILPDVPYEEKAEFAPACRQAGIDFISLVAPTSHERVTMIAKEAEGFIYCVSSLGVTGVRSEISTNIAEMVDRIHAVTEVPAAVGFGISTPQQAAEMAKVADGVIVGSAIVKLIAQYGSESPAHVAAYVREMKAALQQV